MVILFPAIKQLLVSEVNKIVVWRLSVKNRLFSFLFSKTYENFHCVFTICGIKFKFIDKNVCLKKIVNRVDDIFYNQQVLCQVPFVHKYFSQFKNCNIGKEIVLLASGPTLNFYEKIPDAIHCGVNGVIRNIDYLDYLFCIDDFIQDTKLREQIISYKGNNCKKFYGILPQRRIQVLNMDYEFTQRILPRVISESGAYAFLFEDIFQNKWAVDLETEPFGDFGGSVFTALQFLLYTNPKRIYLVGNDCSRGHSYDADLKDDYSCKIDWFKMFKQFKDKVYPNVEVVSINPVGLKGIFKDIYTDKYLESTEVKK